MVKVIVSRDPDDVETALRTLGDATVVDVDAPFDRVVDALLPRGVPGRGFAEQARRNAEAREQFLTDHGALTAEEVAELAGSKAANRRQTAYRWRAAGAVFAVAQHDQLLFPAFQFDTDAGRPRPQVAEALSRLPRGLDGWALALWWDTPRLVDGDWLRPVEVLDDPQRLVAAAAAEAADWAGDGAA